MKNGLYRNNAGAELVVVDYFRGTHRIKNLGGIYEAEARDPLFGTTTYLVTDQSMHEAAYELIEAASDD